MCFSREKFKKETFSRLVLTIKINLDILSSTTTKEVMTMTINEILMEVIANTTNEAGKPMKQVDVIERIEEKFDLKVTQAAFSDRLKNPIMKTNTVIEILDVLGYELVVRPKKDNRKEYVVERGEQRKRGSE
jgi:hypothetical protein